MGRPPDAAPIAPIRRFISSPYAPALASAALLYVSFFPLNWGWLGWIAIVPLLSLTIRPDPRRVYLAGWLCGFAFAVPALQWIRLASPPMYAAWIALALFISMHFLLFVWIARRLTLTAGWPLILVAPTVWTGLEYLRAHVDIGFSWYYLGHTQHDYLPVIQIADVLGAYGVSFLVVFVNVVILQFFTRSKRERGFLVATGCAVVFLAATLGYGFWRLSQTEFEKGPRLALLQGNLPQDIRNDPDEARKVVDHFVQLADAARRLKPDLIVWSETSFVISPDDERMENWLRISPDYDQKQASPEWKEWHKISGEIMQKVWSLWPVPTLLGLNAGILEPDKARKYNSALLIGPDGKDLGRYDKIYRVPWGEYVPWENELPFMRWFTPYKGDYGIHSGKKRTIFSIPKVKHGRFAVLICYEDTVPHLPPEYWRLPSSDAPDFFINISNDGWFKGSEEHEQHLVGARFRAIECRRAVARAVNMGVSAIIDGNGRVVALPPGAKNWKEAKNRTGVVVGNVPIDQRRSLYVRFGDVLPKLCWLFIIVGLWRATLLRRRDNCKVPLRQ